MSAAVDAAIERAKVSEGFRQYPYRDTEGYLTIGYGCCLDSGWDQNLALEVLRYQMAAAEQQIVNEPWYADLNAARQSVLTEMVFNLGFGNFIQFHRLLDALDRKNYADASNEMLNSKWASQVGARAQKLAQIMATGEP
jgi:lysozyme